MEAAYLKIKSFKKLFFVSLGFISLTLGLIGIFIPILPTTPFLLLTSFCFIRSSSRLYQWLITHKVFGSYIYNYLTYRAVKRSTKITALIFLWSSLIISILIVKPIFVKLLLAGIGAGVSTHILLLKSLHQVLPPTQTEAVYSGDEINTFEEETSE